MNLRKAISKECIILNLTSTTKEDVIDELLDVLEATGRIPNRKAAQKAILEREKKMSTGMQHGIAIPHGKTKTVEALVTAIGLKKEGLEFDSLDGEASTIFIMTLTPAKRSGPHIQFLAEISQLLDDEEFRQKLLASETREQVMDLILSAED
jgi:PTS system nitrogen regulatory IIA component